MGDGTVVQFAISRSGEKAHQRKEVEDTGALMPLDEARLKACILESRQIMTSKSKSETIGEKRGEEPNAKTGTPARDPRGDDGKGM